MRRLAPSLISLLGFGLGIAGLLTHAPTTAGILLLLSLAADILDGACARLLGAATRAGADLDFAIDTALAGAMAMRFGWPLLFAPVFVQVLTRGRYSGRALVTVGALAALSS